MLQKFKNLSNKQIALLVAVISFITLYSCHFPYIVEGDTIMYLVRMEIFAQDGLFVFCQSNQVLSMVKHIGYLALLGCFRILTPFFTPEGTVTFSSCLFSSLTLAVTYLLAVRIFKDRSLAMISTLILFSIRMFLYFTLLGEQYTLQSFLIVLILLLIYDGHTMLAGIVLGLSLYASPSCGYPILAYMYLIWKRSHSWVNEVKIWILPIAIFGPCFFYFYDAYRKNVGWTMASWWSDIVTGVQGFKIVGTQMLDNLVLFSPFFVIGFILAWKQHRDLFWMFILSVVPYSWLVIGGAVTKWWVPVFPLFSMLIAVPFKKRLLKRIFSIFLLVSLVTSSTMMLIPVYNESISQRDVFIELRTYKPIIMRWSSGMLYELYGGDNKYHDILDVEIDGPPAMDRILNKTGYVYLYDYMEIQCRPETTLYGLFLKIAYNNQIVRVKERFQVIDGFDFNYTKVREFPDGTIIWNITRKD